MFLCCNSVPLTLKFVTKRVSTDLDDSLTPTNTETSLKPMKNHNDVMTWNYYPLFRVRSWNNGMRCMFLYIYKYSYGNDFRVNGPLWGESTGDRCIPLTKKKAIRGVGVFYKCYFEQAKDDSHLIRPSGWLHHIQLPEHHLTSLPGNNRMLINSILREICIAVAGGIITPDSNTIYHEICSRFYVVPLLVVV